MWVLGHFLGKFTWLRHDCERCSPGSYFYNFFADFWVTHWGTIYWAINLLFFQDVQPAIFYTKKGKNLKFSLLTPAFVWLSIQKLNGIVRLELRNLFESHLKTQNADATRKLNFETRVSFLPYFSPLIILLWWGAKWGQGCKFHFKSFE